MKAEEIEVITAGAYKIANAGMCKAHPGGVNPEAVAPVAAALVLAAFSANHAGNAELKTLLKETGEKASSK